MVTRRSWRPTTPVERKSRERGREGECEKEIKIVRVCVRARVCAYATVRACVRACSCAFLWCTVVTEIGFSTCVGILGNCRECHPLSACLYREIVAAGSRESAGSTNLETFQFVYLA